MVLQGVFKMNRIFRICIAGFLAAVVAAAVPTASYASVVKKGGKVGGGSDTSTSTSGTAGNKGQGTQKTLDSIIDGAGLNKLGTGNTPPDSVLGQVQIATYFLQDDSGNNYDFAATNENRGVRSTEGFSRFYLIHDGVARFYYRTYTAAHGWSPWCVSKETTPSYDDDSKIQAIQIRVKGYAHTLNDLYYKVVLNDGTVLDWAKNGQTAGTMGTDKYIVALRVGLWHKGVSFPYATKNLMGGCKYDGTYTGSDGVVRYSSFDGQPYTGWGFVDNTQYYFVNGEHVTDWQYIDGYKYYFNEDGSLATDLEPVMGLPGEYQINYNKATRTMYVLARDGDNGFIIPFRTFNSTCGPDTPLGTYATYEKYNVKFMHDDIYCKYLSRFYQGFLIHSILYYTPNLDLDAITYNYIDDAASGGCIRLLTGDAYWIYSNCPMHTTVYIYEDKWDKGPVEKGAIEQAIPREQTWDPTDPASADRVAEEQAAAAEEAKGTKSDPEMVSALTSE